MFLDLKDFPILDRVSNSQRRVKISFSEQDLFAITALLATARDVCPSTEMANVTQELINQICERLDTLNPGFLHSIKSFQRIKFDKGRHYARKVAQKMKERDRQASNYTPLN